MAADTAPAVRSGLWVLLPVVAALALGAQHLLDTGGPAVSRLELIGTFDRVDATAARAALQRELERGFLSLELDAIKQALEALPWVAHARVERAWPSVLRVRISEFEPFARWRDGALVDADGVLLALPATGVPDGLPQLAGPRGSERQVIETFQALQRALAPGPFALAALTLEDRGEWVATTRSGLALKLGRGEPLAQAARLTGVVAREVVPHLDLVAYLDLRYSNGFAVGWKDGIAPALAGAAGLARPPSKLALTPNTAGGPGG